MTREHAVRAEDIEGYRRALTALGGEASLEQLVEHVGSAETDIGYIAACLIVPATDAAVPFLARTVEIFCDKPQPDAQAIARIARMLLRTNRLLLVSGACRHLPLSRLAIEVLASEAKLPDPEDWMGESARVAAEDADMLSEAALVTELRAMAGTLQEISDKRLANWSVDEQ